ncbi:MAG TPA: protein kinase, partial [Gemmataceae bacterium]|nr:protein kinase [Gemmataceae bacterium]
MVGTPSYMAPEQARGRPGDVGPAADVYALGAILYELLTGRPPFRGATVLDTLDQVCGQEPVPPGRLSPKVPRDLETICLKCLEKRPARRYATALELADDLRHYAAGEPIRARPVGPVERGRKWVRRRPALAAALAAMVLVAAVGFALVTWKWRAEVVAHGDAETARQAEGEALRAQQELTTRLSTTLDRQRDLTGQLETALAQGNRSNLYLHLMSLAQQAFGFNRVDKVLELLNECPPDLRGWEWHLMRRQATGGRGLVRTPSESGNSIAV